MKATLIDFFKLFSREKNEPLFQNACGEVLSKNTAHHWMDGLIKQIRLAGLPIFIDKGFGWHAFRRTYTRMFLENGGDIFNLKRNAGWTYTSTVSHYLGDSKQTVLSADSRFSFMRKEDP